VVVAVVVCLIGALLKYCADDTSCKRSFSLMGLDRWSMVQCFRAVAYGSWAGGGGGVSGLVG